MTIYGINFGVLWDAPVKDDPWGSVANYDQIHFRVL